VTAPQFRRIVLGLDGVFEAAHMGHPDFRTAGGRIFATLRDNDTLGMVTLTPEQQAGFVQDHPAIFSPESGAWGRQGSTRVTLAAADVEVVGEAVTLAWQLAVQKGPTRGAKRPLVGATTKAGARTPRKSSIRATTKRASRAKKTMSGRKR
jgi:hypothetical protein